VRVLLTWDESTIRGDTSLKVDVDVPAPFNMLPSPLLETIVGGAAGFVLDELLRVFLRNLSADFTRWATDSAYRDARSRWLAGPSAAAGGRAVRAGGAREIV